MKPNLEQAKQLALRFFAKCKLSPEVEFELANGKTVFVLRSGKVSRKASFPSLP